MVFVRCLGESAIVTRGHNLEPTIDANPVFHSCTAKAKCPNGASLTCEVKGSGTCSGTDGVGVQCITYNKDGDPEESGGVCAGQ